MTRSEHTSGPVAPAHAGGAAPLWLRPALLVGACAFVGVFGLAAVLLAIVFVGGDKKANPPAPSPGDAGAVVEGETRVSAPSIAPFSAPSRKPAARVSKGPAVEQCIEAMRADLAASPDPVTAREWAMLARLAARTGRRPLYQSSIDAAQAALRSSPQPLTSAERIDIMLTMAHAMYEVGDDDGAGRLFQTVLDDDLTNEPYERFDRLFAYCGECQDAALFAKVLAKARATPTFMHDEKTAAVSMARGHALIGDLAAAEATLKPYWNTGVSGLHSRVAIDLNRMGHWRAAVAIERLGSDRASYASLIAPQLEARRFAIVEEMVKAMAAEGANLVAYSEALLYVAEMRVMQNDIEDAFRYAAAAAKLEKSTTRVGVLAGPIVHAGRGAAMELWLDSQEWRKVPRSRELVLRALASAYEFEGDLAARDRVTARADESALLSHTPGSADKDAGKAFDDALARIRAGDAGAIAVAERLVAATASPLAPPPGASYPAGRPYPNTVAPSAPGVPGLRRPSPNFPPGVVPAPAPVSGLAVVDERMQTRLIDALADARQFDAIQRIVQPQLRTEGRRRFTNMVRTLLIYDKTETAMRVVCAADLIDEYESVPVRTALRGDPGAAMGYADFIDKRYHRSRARYAIASALLDAPSP